MMPRTNATWIKDQPRRRGNHKKTTMDIASQDGCTVMCGYTKNSGSIVHSQHGTERCLICGNKIPIDQKYGLCERCIDRANSGELSFRRYNGMLSVWESYYSVTDHKTKWRKIHNVYNPITGKMKKDK